MLADGGAHAVAVARPDEVAHQRAARRGEGHHHHEQDAADAADNVRHRQRPLAQVLDVEEEQEPRGQRQEVLQHRPERHVEHPPQHRPLQPRDAVEPVLAAVDAAAGVDHEEHERHPLGQRRADGGSGDAQRGQAQIAEDEEVVEHHVAHDHDDRVQRQRARLRGAQEEGAEDDGAEREEGAEHAPVQVVRGRLVNLRRGDDALQQQGREAVGQQEQHGGQPRLEVDALVEQGPYLAVLSLAVAAGDEYLRADAEAEGHHEDDHVEDAGDGRCAQFDLAHAAQEGGVRHSDELLHDEADEDGVGNVPDLAVGVCGLCHACEWGLVWM